MSISVIIPASEAVSILQSGGVVAVPTETVYGLAARCTDVAAIHRIFTLKGRPPDNPLILHVSSETDINIWAVQNEISLRLADHFWPGPLTMVLPRLSSVPDIVTAGLDTVGIRMPDHPTILQIISAVGEPLAAPSANISGKPSPTCAAHVRDDHPEGLPIVDGGTCRRGIESTVIRISDNEIFLLRPGNISRQEIERVSGIEVKNAGGSDLARSPGTRHPHYAPRARIRLFNTEADLLQAVSSDIKQRILSMTDLDSPLGRDVLSGSGLYSSFRKADDLSVDEILVLCDDAVVRDEALWNRLQRAGEPRNEDKPIV